MRQQMRASVPRNRREILHPYGHSAATYPSSGNMILFVEGPQQGKLWDIRSVVVGGHLVTDTPAGTAYAMEQMSPSGDLPLSALRSGTLTPFPVVGTWGSGAWRMRWSQNLYVVITGGTTGTYYTAYADIQEFDDTPLMQTVFDV
jgi:hypothetical protein